MLALALVAVAVASVVFATRSDPDRLLSSVDPEDLPAGPPAPPLQVTGWLNSPPLAPAGLRDKVVLYDFWTYSCVNCVRTLPYLRAWQRRYEQDGLVIVGVHSPEFEFEKDHDNVAEAVRDLGVTWPVAFDDEMDTWDAFGNRFWPAKYVYDRGNRLRYRHFGEGAYEQTEDVLRELLGVDDRSPRARRQADDPETVSESQTPETYLGSARGRGGFTLRGRWLERREYVESVGSGARIVLEYRASEVNLVMAPAGDSPVEIAVEVDGRRARRIRVDRARMYRLVEGLDFGEHVLTLTAGAGLRAYAFTFGT